MYHLRVMDLSEPERARAELERIGADAAGVARMIDKAGFLAIRVEGLKAPAANILKQEMLSLGADAAVARGVVNASVDRSDALILGTRKQVRRLVRKLRPQPFGLKALAAELQELLGREEPREFRWHGGVLRLDGRPLVMGILNVTPDSFSDGGDYFDREAALDRALQMVEEGADLLDVGGESTRPGAPPVPLEEEERRVVPVIEHLAHRVGVPISVDTYKAGVARRAVEAGAALVNDVSGLRMDPAMAGTVAGLGAGLVVMHMRGDPRTMQSDTRYADLVGEIFRALEESVDRAVEAGVDRARVWVDPGIGFGKSAEQNLVLLRRLAEFRSLGCPVLVGASRKSFIGRTLGIEDPKDRLEGSLAAAVVAVWNGARILRVHDVRATRRAADLAWAAGRATEE
ncbi:dihydropteroate synthase [Deferrisoma camini]|uniref:dihydropteroate synthase n=1 Tax=Deferrisoma camini TaxID=1035120 RepID=UPI00046CC5D6|nr:dihydropteroate synthase [Deferrisoma camini]